MSGMPRKSWRRHYYDEVRQSTKKYEKLNAQAVTIIRKATPEEIHESEINEYRRNSDYYKLK